jgi:hypothetical protein
MRYRSGLRNSPDDKKLKPEQLDTVLESLREKSGFLEMHFDEDGFLILGDRTRVAGGSATARNLISAAVDGEISIDLECHNYSSIVAFARSATPTIYRSQATGKTIEVHPIELDFSDFSKLRGDKRVLSSFDVGFIILHELGHAVLKLHDAMGDSGGLGECEEYINHIRRELNLPERQHYAARLKRGIVSISRKTIAEAELTFAQRGDAEGGVKAQSYSLKWEADLVGPVRQSTARSQEKGGFTTPVPVLASKK